MYISWLKLMLAMLIWAPLTLSAQVIVQIEEVSGYASAVQPSINEVNVENSRVIGENLQQATPGSEEGGIVKVTYLTGMEVSPNPFDSYFVIGVGVGVKVFSFRLLDDRGALVFEASVGKLPHTTIISSLSPDTYTLEVDTSEGMYSEVVVKE